MPTDPGLRLLRRLGERIHHPPVRGAVREETVKRRLLGAMLCLAFCFGVSGPLWATEPGLQHLGQSTHGLQKSLPQMPGHLMIQVAAKADCWCERTAQCREQRWTCNRDNCPGEPWKRKPPVLDTPCQANCARRFKACFALVVEQCDSSSLSPGSCNQALYPTDGPRTGTIGPRY